MTKTNEIKDIIISSFIEERECRVYFKDCTAPPVYGRFVELKDHDELLNKNMVRFCPGSKIADFEATGKSHFTRIYAIAVIKQIKFY
jgi:hypothetical protein